MKNRTLAIWLIIAFAVNVLLGLSEDETFLFIGGIMIWTFGVWAIVKLYNLKD